MLRNKSSYLKLAEKLIYFFIAVCVVGLNVWARHSKGFSDAYITFIFPIWGITYGRFTGMFTGSVGEILIVCGVVLVVLAALMLPFLLGFSIRKTIHKIKKLPFHSKCYSFVKNYYRFFLWVLLFVSLIMTLNCFILYQGSTFAQMYFAETKDAYNQENLVHLWNTIADHVNELSMQVERDENGMVLYQGRIDGDDSDEMKDESIAVMQELGKKYPRLRGYYSRPKQLRSSDFMCQQYMEGYYFPFSLEANYNDVMYVMNKPSCMCHELAHLKGYILEDEANFISYMACVESDDIYFQYSGYMSVISYVAKELSYSIKHDPDFESKGYSVRKLLSQVKKDNVFVLDEDWERIEGKAILKTETVDQASNTFVDTTLKVNGVSDGKKSYNRVVQLLLLYYNR